MEASDIENNAWSQLIDEPYDWPVDSAPHTPGNTFLPQQNTPAMAVPSAAAATVMAHTMATSPAAKSSSKKNSGAGNNSNDPGNKHKFPWWLVLLLFLLLGSSAYAMQDNRLSNALQSVGIQGPAGQDGKDGSPGKDGLSAQGGTIASEVALVSSGGTAGAAGADGAAGANGTNGSNGAAGAAGAVGADGVDGSNDCISGICVSRQTSSPGTQETGNINIDGKILASQIGVNVTPTNTLSVGGTANIGGHSAIGSGATVNGYLSALDPLQGVTANYAISSNYETITTLSAATTLFSGNLSALTLNPGAAPTYGGATGSNSIIEVASGNTRNFTSGLSGMFGEVLHNGTGTVSSARGLTGNVVNLSSGTIGDAIAVNAVGISNLGTIDNAFSLVTGIAFNMGTITNSYGVKIATANNAGTILNNYGLYIDDQSSIGSTASYNIYSAGATAKNYFAGLVSVGSTGTAGTVEKFRVGTPTTADNLANSILSTSATTSKGLVIQGKASQSANLQEWQDSTGSTLAAMSASGHLGIGSSTPGNSEIYVTAAGGDTANIFLTQDYSGHFINIQNTYSASSDWNIANTAGGMYMYNAAGTTSIDLLDNGNVGVGTVFSGAGVKLTVKETSDTNVLRLTDTDGTCDHNPESGSETVSCSSDARLKTNITDAASVLSEISGLKIHDYTVIASGNQTTGLIAQEVLETNPEMVHMGDDGYYKVDSYNSWKLLKGVQELSTNADNLQTTLTAALTQTKGDLAATNEQLSALGLRVDDLSATLQDYADQLADHDQRIQSLETKVRNLEQNNNGTPTSQ